MSEAFPPPARQRPPAPGVPQRPSTRTALHTVLAMIATVLAVVLLALFNYEGWFGPALCWPKDYDADRAARILGSVGPVIAYERLREACRQGDKGRIRKLITSHMIWRTRMESISGETFEFKLIEPMVHRTREFEPDPKATWEAWLAGKLASGRGRIRVPLQTVPRRDRPTYVTITSPARIMPGGANLDVDARMQCVQGEWRFAGFDPAEPFLPW